MKKMMTCPRCNGEKRIKEYRHFASGICFKCNGKGEVPYRKQRTPKQVDPKIAEDNQRRYIKALEIYRNDSRIQVKQSHAYFGYHTRELAQSDGIWESL